ncbi:MAG: cobalamin B12-binding domain-containing protein, partial [Bdellovibrionaceae bacterium]|nr:cobalamin B12-binding domain-containing protein [Pseudobdellovibrionaceae bacterium]
MTAQPPVKRAICLATLNSTWQHTSFGLRYLKANLGELEAESQILEFTIRGNPREIAKTILATDPRIVGFGVYIWNTSETLRVLREIRSSGREILIVLGGPEVSHESETQEICKLADFVIKGEGDVAFRELCQSILRGQPPSHKFISAPLPEVQKLALPYR